MAYDSHKGSILMDSNRTSSQDHFAKLTTYQTFKAISLLSRRCVAFGTIPLKPYLEHWRKMLKENVHTIHAKEGIKYRFILLLIFSVILTIFPSSVLSDSVICVSVSPTFSFSHLHFALFRCFSLFFPCLFSIGLFSLQNFAK